jgi:hypothetical protein
VCLLPSSIVTLTLTLTRTLTQTRLTITLTLTLTPTLIPTPSLTLNLTLTLLVTKEYTWNVTRILQEENPLRSCCSHDGHTIIVAVDEDNMVRKYKVELDPETSQKRAHFLSDLSRLTLPAKHLALTKDGAYVAIASEGALRKDQ